MRHLKTKILFESREGKSFHDNLKNTLDYSTDKNPIIEDIKDICLDVLDNGFFVEMYSQPLLDMEKVICLTMWKFPNMKPPMSREGVGNQLSFKYSDISEDVERLKNYLGNKLIDVREWSTNGYWVPLSLSSRGGSTITGLIITFKL